jgi:hypothetical protein
MRFPRPATALIIATLLGYALPILAIMITPAFASKRFGVNGFDEGEAFRIFRRNVRET